MSESNTSHLPSSLEDALKEIESLRSQLSGSDLKVFSQNRELRVQNTEFKEQIRSLTEQAVSQSFQVRGLEKSEAKLKDQLGTSETRVAELEGQVSTLQAEIAGLKEQISGLEEQVTDLGGQLEEHRSRELNLSQELEATIAKNDETVAQLKAEQDELARQRAAEMEEANRRFEDEVKAREEARQKFEDEVRAKEEAIKALEDRVEQFKEEFLSQEFAPVAIPEPQFAGQSGRAYQLLCEKMEGLLGYPGKALVEQVFRLSGVDQSSSNPSELEETFEVLQDTASQLVKSPEQEKELALLLEDAWKELGMGGESPSASAAPSSEPLAATPEAPTEEPAPAPEPEAEVESEPEQAQVEPESAELSEPPTEEAVEEPSAEQSAVQEESAEVVEAEPAAVEPMEEAEIPAEETAAEDFTPPDLEPTPELEVVEPSAEVEDEPEVEPVSELPSSPAGDLETEPTVEAAAATAEAASQDRPEDEEESAGSAPQAGAEGDYDAAAALLQDGQFAEALAIFESLQSGDSEENAIKVGRLACLAGLGRFSEAYTLVKDLQGEDLEDNAEIFGDSAVTTLMGLASEAENDLQRKQYILELAKRSESAEQIQAFLDEADEIPLRIPQEGELSLLQAKHRVAQDDVTEYLIDALHSLSDRQEVFSLLKSNLERYPELQPLSDFMESLLDSSRAESLEAEAGVKELLGQGEAVEDVLDELDPGEEAVIQVFLEHLIPRSEMEVEVPCEEFEEWLADAEPAAFVGSLRQALRSVDYTVFFDEIEVLSYDGDERFLLRSSPEPSPTLLFGSELDDVPPEELRFLVLRELFSMYRKHSQLNHISSGLDDLSRAKLVKACVEIFNEFETKVTPEIQDKLDELLTSGKEGGQDSAFRQQLEAFLSRVYRETESDSFLELGDFLYGCQLNKKWLDSISDGFAARQTGMVVASYAICRDQMEEDDFEKVEEEGFAWLYKPENLEKYHELRLRLQRLWTTPLKALISEPEE